MREDTALTIDFSGGFSQWSKWNTPPRLGAEADKPSHNLAHNLAMHSSSTHSPIFSQKQWLFDLWAPRYDWLFPSVVYQALHQRLLEYLKLPETPQVLDLGCGTGKLLLRLSATFPQLQGIGVDLSPQMIQQAQARLQSLARTSALAQGRLLTQQPQHERLQFLVANAEQLPWAEPSFDAVFNTMSFLHYPNPEAVLTQVHQVLKPGGHYYLVDITARWATEPLGERGQIRLYSPSVRERLGQAAGLYCQGHYYLLGPVVLSIFRAI